MKMEYRVSDDFIWKMNIEALTYKKYSSYEKTDKIKENTLATSYYK